MRKFLLCVLSVLFFHCSYSVNPTEKSEFLSITNTNTSIKSNISLNNNYQQFKFQVVNFEPKPDIDYASFSRRRRKKDNTMLYVAGGLAVATGVLILTNNPENFTSNSSSSVNLGIAIGGTVACGLFLAKYFIDRGR